MLVLCGHSAGGAAGREGHADQLHLHPRHVEGSSGEGEEWHHQRIPRACAGVEGRGKK